MKTGPLKTQTYHCT